MVQCRLFHITFDISKQHLIGKIEFASKFKRKKRIVRLKNY
jgi:hypothetical protein